MWRLKPPHKVKVNVKTIHPAAFDPPRPKGAHIFKRCPPATIGGGAWTGGLLYRGVTGQSPVPKRFKRL
ncbi:MAG: hypothetical protein LBH93_00795 [Chitinispirillales bacterium]|nr:hypothetical protein [Chitinispirillales bacterium]